MAYASLMNSRSDFSNFGSSLASIQENAVDVAASNEQTQTFYQSLTTQLTSTGLIEGFPSVVGVVSAGKGLYASVKRLGDIKPLLEKGLGEGKDLLQSGASDLLKTGKKGLGQLETGVNELKAKATTVGETIQSETSNLVSNIQQATSNVMNSAQASGEGVLATAQTEAANAVSTVEKGVSAIGAEIRSSIVPSVQAAAETRFSLPLATKRPMTVEPANTLTGDSIHQQSLAMLEPEEPISINLGFTRDNMAGLSDLNPVDTINGLMTSYSDVTSGLRPALNGFGQRFMSFFGGQSSTAQSAVSASANNVVGAGRQAVTTTMNTATTEASGVLDSASSAVRNVAGAGEAVVNSAVETGSALASTAVDAGETAAKLVVGLGDIALPVIGEIGLIGVGVYSAIQGFEDLFSHPAAPKVSPVPVMGNISQSFQSGI